MKKRMLVSTVQLVVAGFMVAALPGCDFFKKTTDAETKQAPTAQHDMPVGLEELPQADVAVEGPVLISIDGKPVLGMHQFEQHLEKMLQAYPHLKGMKPSDLPRDLKIAVLNKLGEQELIVKWAANQGMDQSDEFKQIFNEGVQNLKRLMLVQEFEKGLLNTVEASDSEIRREYEATKDKMIKSRGGVLVAGVSFGKEEDATKFFADAQSKPAEFTKMAKAATGGNYRSFGRVNEQTTSAPEAIKDAALKATKVPSVLSVKVDGDTWVVYASEKTGPEYMPFDEVKGYIESSLRNQKFQAALAARLNELKKGVSVTINESLIEGKPLPAEPTSMPAAEEQVGDEDIETIELSSAKSQAVVA